MEQSISKTQEVIELSHDEMKVILTALKIRKYYFEDIDRGEDFISIENNLISIFQEDYNIKSDV